MDSDFSQGEQEDLFAAACQDLLRQWDASLLLHDAVDRNRGGIHRLHGFLSIQAIGGTNDHHQLTADTVDVEMDLERVHNDPFKKKDSMDLLAILFASDGQFRRRQANTHPPPTTRSPDNSMTGARRRSGGQNTHHFLVFVDVQGGPTMGKYAEISAVPVGIQWRLGWVFSAKEVGLKEP
jgi:hypothetical protein